MSEPPATPQGGAPDAAPDSAQTETTPIPRRRRIVRRVIGAVVLVILIAVVGLYGAVTWFVNSGRFKAQLEQRASALAEVQVHIDSVVFVPFSTLIAWNVHVGTGDKALPEPALHVERVEINVDVRECLRGNWVIREVKIRSPHVLLQENDKGEVAIEAVPESKDEDNKAEAVTKDQDNSQVIDFAVQAASVTGGSLAYINRKKQHTLNMTGINIATTVGVKEGEAHADGKVSVGAITIADKLQITGFSSPLEVSENKLDLPGLNADVYKGKLTGKALARLAKPGVPYTINLKIDGLDTAEFLKAFGEGSDVEMGTLQLSFDGGGRLDQASKIHGGGWLSVGPFKSKGVPLLGTLGSLMGVPAFADIQFEKIRAKYNVKNEVGIIDAMQTYPLGGKIVVIGAGTVGFDSKVNFQGEATVDSGLAKVVNDVVKTLLLKSNDGLMTVPFTITGQASDPKINISPEGVGGGILQAILDFIPIIPTNKIFESSLRKHVEAIFGDQNMSPEDIRKREQEAAEKKKEEDTPPPPGANKDGVKDQGPQNSPFGTKGMN